MKNMAKREKGLHVSIRCGCGKPITHSNEFGMFCEDECGLEKSKTAASKLRGLLGDFDAMFKGLVEPQPSARRAVPKGSGPLGEGDILGGNDDGRTFKEVQGIRF